ncbi:hypothetical protein CDD82_7042 [Ophiocordyceps australis]|uniref:FAD-dependent oxidoreductase 2 FAD-binding domain-containing protein n=1 Tax=Ophiocordyceps australis TaxID=1399860 RepID=A0A2C5YSG3_9HYPO|nr:hypothetical protein CDD82_7042 [Ophiocordyceps australis]
MADDTQKKPDVIVVGGGLSGMCAAVAAAEEGARVTVLDRGFGGGASFISGGVVYAGGGTKYQAQAGYHDTPDNMFCYLKHEAGNVVDDAVLRRFCNESVSNLEWLEGHGARFSGAMPSFRTSYPAGEYHLHYSGNEMAFSAASVAKPAPRGHRAVGQGLSEMEMTGAALWGAIYHSALRLGVRLEPAARVDKLLADSEGRVKGVGYRCLSDSAPWLVASYKWLTHSANRYQTMIPALSRLYNGVASFIWHKGAVQKCLEAPAVILAAGGFIMNDEMTRAFVPWASQTAPLGTAGDDGQGIRLGQSVRGRVSHMDRMSAWRFIYPPEALSEGIVLSPKGERLMAEDSYGAFLTEAMMKRASGHGFLILDSLQWEKFKSQIQVQTRGMWRFLVNYIRVWHHKSATSIEELANKFSIDASNMREAVEAYNKAIINSEPDPVEKVNYRSVISSPPFYGIDISVRSSGFMMVLGLTLGGLDVDGETGMVLNEEGKTIPGLYAAGRNAVGICSNRYVSGLSLADCVFSGRRAGRHAFQNQTTWR